MNLKEKIQGNLNSALKGKEKIETSTLRMLNAQILNKEKEKRYKLSKDEPGLKEEELVEKSELTDEEVIQVVSSEIKKRKESILEFEKGERQDLVEQEKKEIEVLKKYLPEQLSEEEIKKLVKEAIEKTGVKEIKDMGKIMAELMPQIKGKADGTTVSKIVKELLAPLKEE
jgi:uncharacterized protein YqeY